MGPVMCYFLLPLRRNVFTKGLCMPCMDLPASLEVKSGELPLREGIKEQHFCQRVVRPRARGLECAKP